MPSQAVIDFKLRTAMPSEDVDELEAKHAGYLDLQLTDALSEIYSRLRKRYRTPMVPIPGIVLAWQAKLVTPEAYLARGYNPQDPSVIAVDTARNTAREQMKEAADTVQGLYDLPLLEASGGSAIDRGGPKSYSEPSPYDWMDRQSEAIRGR